MGDRVVNLNEVGAFTKIGTRDYGGSAEDSVGSAKNSQAKFEGVQPNFKGASGSTFQGLGGMAVGNLAGIAKQIALKANDSVNAEKTAIGADDEGTQVQNTARGVGEGVAQIVTKPITA